MRRFNLSSPQDFLALVVRRKWWIVFPFLGLSCAALLLTYMLPRMYVSQAVVMIRPRDVPKDFVKDLISGSPEQRVSTIEQIVLSRTNLKKILDEFEKDFPEYRKMDNDQKVWTLRKDISTDFTIGTQIGKEELPLSSFRISYKNRNPALAQQIAERLTGLFIEQDNRVREAQVVGTNGFLSEARDEIAAKLKDSDTKLKMLRASHRGSLPDQQAANFAMLANLVDQKKTNFEAKDRLVTELANVERDLATTAPKLIVPKTNVVAKVTRNPLLDEYVTARAALKAIIADGHIGNHPDYIKATNQLERIKSQLSPADLASLDHLNDPPPVVATDETIPNPAYENLTSRRNNLLTELKIRDTALASTDAEIEKYNLRIQSAPQTEQDIAEAVRENLDLNNQLQDMSTKLTTARLSERAESSQKGSQFIVVDPANYPIAPSKPAKTAIAGVGVMLSLFAGFAIGIAIDLANQKMWTLSDVEALVGAPVLVEIPEIVTPADLKAGRRKKRSYVALIAVLLAVYCACLYLVYTHQSSVLSRLEPVIMRLY